MAFSPDAARSCSFAARFAAAKRPGKLQFSARLTSAAPAFSQNGFGNLPLFPAFLQGYPARQPR
jgi:hypothetical protein